MTEFTPLIASHAVAALVVLLLGPLQIWRRRRDRAHRYLGRTWAVAMVVTCLTSFLIHPHGFSWLHGLSLVTLGSLTLGIVGIRRRDVRMHTRNLIGSYLGTVAAFAFAALVPTRLIQTTLHQDPATILGVAAAVLLAVAAWSAGVLRLTRARSPRPARRPGAGAAASRGDARAV
ncbi:DUF2306 domain-containing protein [Arsenicicoccus sp. oral taxon 190]|uniref:DUF2306 domain-containing protein n=1 Tax=Arsenicicoccus sp. oral taxon 190 TaxID=1658671 RepID=UPI000679EBE5|nr:DUF2306 domain-containing protein [Arsenicicoccus sp. oral taxon 190]AKT50769.1 hypothetical protein ADJ73_04625 [Arsenicicoccus sp. oral taxon 190]